MKQTKNNFHYNMIKGRGAEAIIKELFQANGYRVYDYGMERTLPHAFISKEKIQTIEFSELEAGKSLPGSELNDLENSSQFQLDNDLVKQYKEYSKTFYKGVK